jgi:uncharacterized membrane protein
MTVSHVVSESHWRSAFKGMSYRLFATLVTATVSLLMTGSFKTAVIIGSAEASAKVLLYWVHERIWTRVSWGRLHKVVSVDGAKPSPAPPAHASKGAGEHAAGQQASLPIHLDGNVKSPPLDVMHPADEPSHAL